jgi:hypothetical protein
MHAIFKEGLKHAENLRDWYSELSTALLVDFRISMYADRPANEQDPPIGVVVYRLHDALKSWTEQYHSRPGRHAGKRARAQSVACWLVWFLDRHAPGAPEGKRQDFVFRAMQRLNIPYPKGKRDSQKWFSELEKLAVSSAAGG